MDFEAAVCERIPIVSVLVNNFPMAIERSIPDAANLTR
jgi:hypothetical protein